MRQAEQYTCPKCGTQFQAGKVYLFRQGDIRVCPTCRSSVLIDLPPPPREPMDATPYGHELAERVADYLEAAGEVPCRHPYFRGVCLAKID